MLVMCSGLRSKIRFGREEIMSVPVVGGCRLPIADCRLPIADCRLPTATLQTTLSPFFTHTFTHTTQHNTTQHNKPIHLSFLNRGL